MTRDATGHHPPVPDTPTRRHILLGLAAIAPAVLGFGVSPIRAQPADDTFLRVSRIIAGNDSLTPEVAARIEGLLAARTDGFGNKLAKLETALQAGGADRDAMLSGLDEDQARFALDIAKPWYLGYVGDPSGLILDDDAEFATFLEAQGYEKVGDNVPFLTYPPGAAGWWVAAPEGVDDSDLPADIRSWAFQPRETYEISPPDPGWRAYASGDGKGKDDGTGGASRRGTAPDGSSNAGGQGEGQ